MVHYKLLCLRSAHTLHSFPRSCLRQSGSSCSVFCQLVSLPWQALWVSKSAFSVCFWTLIIWQVSWRFLNRCTIYGDYALVGFTAACSLLYLGIRTNNVESALHLTIGIAGTYVLSLGLATISYRLSPFHPLAKYSGPLLWRTSSLPLVIVSVTGHRHLVIEALHRQYGKVIRIGKCTTHH